MVSGAATTTTPGAPVATGTTGACTPSSARTAESRSAPGSVAAHSVTEYPSLTNCCTCAANRAGSPATGLNRRTVMASGRRALGHRRQGQHAGRRVLEQAIEGQVQPGRPLAQPSSAPQVTASASASAASSSSNCTARSRMRRGSTSTTCEPVGKQVGQQRLVGMT